MIVKNENNVLKTIENIAVNKTISYSINTEKLISYLIKKIDELFVKNNLTALKDIKLNDNTALRLNEIILFSFNKKTLNFSENTLLNLCFENTLNNIKRMVTNKSKKRMVLKKQSFDRLIVKIDRKDNIDNLTALNNAMIKNTLEISNDTYLSVTERNKTFTNIISIDITEKHDITALKDKMKIFAENNIIKNAMIA